MVVRRFGEAGDCLSSICCLICALLIFCPLPGSALGQDQVSQLRAAGTLRCGLSELSPGFAEKVSGRWAGFDVETCRAVALAVLGDADAVVFVETSEASAFEALRKGELDLVARAPAPPLASEGHGVQTTAVTFHDGIGLMVQGRLDIQRADEISDASLCAGMGEAILAATEAARERFGWSQNLLVYDRLSEAADAFFAGRCDVLIGMRSHLAGLHRERVGAGQHRVLPDLLTFVPTGPLVRRGDPDWGDLVSWTAYALIEAEERSVTQENVHEMSRDPKAHPAVRRLLGVEGDLAGALGLDRDWVVKIISELGNYAQIYARTLGERSPIALTRGPNALWSDGGLIQSRPFQ